ncbi:transglutaminase domain-containing protein [Poritiphilus flavus]|nr:transglutaminase domain-containing protein [Poritiphilus flavus]
MGFKILFFLFFPAAVFCQDFSDVDNKVMRYPDFESVTDLSYRIQNDFNEDVQRVRAAFFWVTQNLTYGKHLEDDFRGEAFGSYAFPTSTQTHIDNLVQSKINRAFNAKRGVCIDYSLVLNALFEQFGLKSRIITGVSKSEITKTNPQSIFKDHSWNAVKVDGQWRLMDPTWASGLVDRKSKRFYRLYEDHYFFTEPEEFVKTHFPIHPEWQLLKNPVNASTFFSGPIFYPEFFRKGIRLSTETDGILSLSNPDENYIHFDELPRLHGMTYTINGRDEFKRLGLKKKNEKAYISKIHLKRRLKRSYDFLTVYMDNKPILNFKIEP